MPNRPPVPKDWNPVIHILDELSDGAHSVTELLYSADLYDRQAYVDAILLLVGQRLVQFTRQPEKLDPLTDGEAAEVIQTAMSVPQEDRGTFSTLDVDLTETGEQVLALLGLGHS